MGATHAAVLQIGHRAKTIPLANCWLILCEVNLKLAANRTSTTNNVSWYLLGRSHCTPTWCFLQGTSTTLFSAGNSTQWLCLLLLRMLGFANHLDRTLGMKRDRF